MMKAEYREGPEAKESFEKMAKALFQASKATPRKQKGKDKPISVRKSKNSDKD
jgi:soluble cytochrome b562